MTTIETKSEAKPNGAEVRVLRAATCSSLSGKSTLTYELGCDGAAALQLRIAKNSGKGMFSPEALDLALSFDTWIRLRQVQRLGRASGKRVVALTCGALLHDRAASVVG